MNIIYCDYGCGQEAKFKLKNGKHCCSKSWSQCPANKKRNSEGILKAKEEGRGPWNKESGWNGSLKNKEALLKGSKTHIDHCREKAFTENSIVTNASLKNFLIRDYNWELRCHKCGLTEWQGEKIPLELHHKNGISTDNRLENLEFLCLNCHAITDSFRGKNINSGKIKVSKEELKKALQETNSIREALIKVGLAPKGGNYSRAYKILSEIKNE